MNRKNDPIYVTRPYLPPLDKFIPYLEKIWTSGILTNNGQFHRELEQKLCDYLGVKFISLFSNGTMALIGALKVLNISGEVITTPFTFVATSHALLWNNIKPVFVDIDPITFNLDPDKIEAAITSKTRALLPVHIFGNPCKIERIKDIAVKYNLKVIYDAAHAFGVKLNGTSVLNFGDLSVLSFHAIKVFNTFEGGAVICHDQKTKDQLDQFKNFGIKNDNTIESLGLNSKMNEFQAALGVLQLKYVNSAIIKRGQIVETYQSNLKFIPGISFTEKVPDVDYNYAYFPILIDSVKFGKSRNKVFAELRKHGIYSRRYFYPLVNQFQAYKDLHKAKPERMSIAERVTEQILCLPIYPDLKEEKVIDICNIISNMKHEN